MKNRYRALEGVSQLSAFLGAYGVRTRAIKSTAELIRIAALVYEIPESPTVKEMATVVAAMSQARRRELARKNLHLVGVSFSRQKDSSHRAQEPRYEMPSQTANSIIRRAARRLNLRQNDKENLEMLAQRIALAYGLDAASINCGKQELAALIWKAEAAFWKAKREPAKVISVGDKRLKEFYNSPEWVRLSYDVKKERGRRCECCGATPDHGVRIITDHVKPIRKYWHLRLDRTNLQVLCDDCNLGKGSRDETDFRTDAEPETAVAAWISAQLTPPDGILQ